MPSILPNDGHRFRRVEVLTGTPRRRRWSAAEKAAIVTESQAPGAQTSEIALRCGLHHNQLYDCRREFGSAAVGNAIAEVSAQGPAFIPVVADNGSWRGGDRDRDCQRIVRVTAGVDPALLGNVLRLLKPMKMIPALSAHRRRVCVLIATRQVDFRRGADGLATTVQSVLQQHPFSGTIFVFRSKRAHCTSFSIPIRNLLSWRIPWHPLYGQRVRAYSRQGRADRQILYIEVRPGLSREIPAWMCDAAACAEVTCGSPRLAIAALTALRAVLDSHSGEEPSGATPRRSAFRRSGRVRRVQKLPNYPHL